MHLKTKNNKYYIKYDMFMVNQFQFFHNLRKALLIGIRYESIACEIFNFGKSIPVCYSG